MATNPDSNPLFVICGGIHSWEITENFVCYISKLIADTYKPNICIIPTVQIAPYDALNIYEFIHQKYGTPAKSDFSLVVVAFSAGVVGSIGFARLWYRKGGTIKCLLAFDGWGVPLIANFPCYRISHDYFTHYTSHFLGGEPNAFYACPAISHLDLWRSPYLVQGYQQKEDQIREKPLLSLLIAFVIQTSLAEFIKYCLYLSSNQQ